jgi:multicomponent Na+:H+ antiporter subunit A
MGLRRAMPWTAAIAILAGLSMAGLPLSFGFVAKDVMALAKAEAELFVLASYALVLVNAIAIAVAGVAAIRVFWGPPESPRGRVHEVHWTMLAPPLLIVLLGLEFEFIPNVANPLLLAAAQSISPTLGNVNLQASYDLTALLSTSGVAAGIGLLLFLAWDRLHHVLHRQHWLDRYGPAALYEGLLHGLARLAARHTPPSGSMRNGRRRPGPGWLRAR